MTNIRTNRFQSSCNSIVWPEIESLIFFPIVFHVWSFLFFIGVQMPNFPDWTRSLTKVSKSFSPMPLCPTRSFLTFSGATTFVTRLNSSSFSCVKGLAKFPIVLTNCAMFFSLREITEVVKVWWWVPSFASSARRASSGAMRKNLVWALGFKVMPTNPPDTFMERFICSRAWSAPSPQNGTCKFMFTTQLPLRNPS